MANERNERASSPGLVNSSKELIRGSGASTIFESRLQLDVAKGSAEKSTQSEASTPVSTKQQATKITTQVQPTPPPTSTNSSRSRRSSASLAMPSRLTDSQISDLGSTDEDNAGHKDDEDNEDDEIYDSESDYGEEARARREARDIADDEYLARLREESSTAFTMDTFSRSTSIRPGKDENRKHLTFDRWFITAPVPRNHPNTFISALFPAQTSSQATIPGSPSTPAPSNGFFPAAFNAQGGLFESAFKGGFSERADALISIGGPGMGGDRQWTSEATFELARVTNPGDIAHLDENPAEGEKEHTGRMGNVRWRNKNSFPARKKGGPDYDLDPRDFNRQFEEQARAAKQAEEEAAKRAEEEARKRADALLAFEKLLAKEHMHRKPSRAKELSATHSWPAKTKSYFYTTFASSKKSKEPTKEPVQSAKTWPVKNSFIAKKVEGLLDPKAKESHLVPENEAFRGLVRRFTFGSRDP